MKKLSQRNQELADYYNAYFKKHGRRPTYREAAEALKFASTNSVWVALRRVEKCGAIILGVDSKRGDPDIKCLYACVAALNSCSSDAMRMANLRYLMDRYSKQAGASPHGSAGA